MMGRLERGQGRLFYEFRLDDVVPGDHLVRRIDALVELGWVHDELGRYYSHTGRPSIDPELLIRMLIIGYVFAIRSERQLLYRGLGQVFSGYVMPHSFGISFCSG